MKTIIIFMTTCLYTNLFAETNSYTPKNYTETDFESTRIINVDTQNQTKTNLKLMVKDSVILKKVIAKMKKDISVDKNYIRTNSSKMDKYSSSKLRIELDTKMKKLNKAEATFSKLDSEIKNLVQDNDLRLWMVDIVEEAERENK